MPDERVLTEDEPGNGPEQFTNNLLKTTGTVHMFTAAGIYF